MADHDHWPDDKITAGDTVPAETVEVLVSTITGETTYVVPADLGRFIGRLRADLRDAQNRVLAVEQDSEAAINRLITERHDLALDLARTSAERDAGVRDQGDLIKLLADIWLYVDWRYVTTQLETRQKDLWADAVDACGDELVVADRWWRDG